MKRVKKDFRMELRDGNSLVVAVEFAGNAHIDGLQSAVSTLRCAERAEAEARVRLEALR